VNEIVRHLNERTGSSFRDTAKSTAKAINARLSEGYTVDDFKTVIDKKCAEWMNTEWEKYLRPETLFRPSHFESYLNQRGSPRRNGKSVSQKLIETASEETEGDQIGNGENSAVYQGRIPERIP
jgi:uncharacterized phage protein (TIGR02220 family)